MLHTIQAHETVDIPFPKKNIANDIITFLQQISLTVDNTTNENQFKVQYLGERLPRHALPPLPQTGPFTNTKLENISMPALMSTSNIHLPQKDIKLEVVKIVGDRRSSALDMSISVHSIMQGLQTSNGLDSEACSVAYLFEKEILYFFYIIHL